MKKIVELKEIPVGAKKLVMVDDIPIALFNLNGEIHAWDNRCPHRGASLIDGNISNTIIQCKFHLWEFNVKKACAVANSKIKIKTFKVKIKDQSVYVNI